MKNILSDWEKIIVEVGTVFFVAWIVKELWNHGVSPQFDCRLLNYWFCVFCVFVGRAVKRFTVGLFRIFETKEAYRHIEPRKP